MIMPNEASKSVVAVLDDVFFLVKIADAAKRAGLTLKVVKSEEDALGAAQGKPLLIVLDLNCKAVQPLSLISRLKSGDTKDIPVLGYVSHVQADLRRAAQDTGCDMVVARSAFSQNLPEILKRHAGGG